MKKLLAIILAAACAFSLAACAATPDTPNASAPPATEEQLDCIGDPTTQQLAAPVAVSMPQYPNEAKYTASNGNFDSEKYDEDWDAWWESYQEKTADMTDPAALTHWFTTSIPALMRNAGKENRVCSPLNIYMALSMLAAVTGGETRQQILDALGAESLDALQKQAAQLWAENSWDDGLVTSTLANSIWLRDGYNYNSETLQTLGEDFYASAFSGEMGSDAYNNILRDWINEHTGNLLTEQAGKLELNADTVLALVSTLYYSASWHDKFSSAATTQDVFHAPNGDVSTDFLHSSDSNTVYYGDGFSAIGLSLENSGRMWLLKPDEGVDAAELLQNEDTLGFLLANGEWSQTQRAIVNLSLPKFDVSSDLDILDTLAQLGMTDVLDGIKSDFTPLTAANDSLALTQAKHAARVKIDEDGCEAAAYTILGVEATAMMGPEDEIDFTLDNPFVFAITGIDGLPLFVGLVNQPN
jgi:serine protease inhibitor